MRRTRLTRLIAACALAATATAGTIAVATPAGAAKRDKKLCKALGRIGSLDAQFNEILTGSASWDEAKADLAVLGPKLNTAWDTVVARIPSKLEDEATAVEKFTERALVSIAGAATIEEASDLLTGDEGALEAGTASIALDTYSRKTCDVSINNEG